MSLIEKFHIKVLFPLTIFTIIVVSNSFVSIVHAAGNSPGIYIMSGEVSADSAVVWGRCNQEIDSWLKVNVSKQNKDINRSKDSKLRRNLGPYTTLVTKDTDYTASLIIRGLEPNSDYSYRAECVSLIRSNQDRFARADGYFSTAAAYHTADAVKFSWGADLAGQGWGRNEELEIVNTDGETVKGGFLVYDTMAKMKPDFIIHQGDNIYADNAIPAQKDIPAELGGGIWTNTTPKDFIAITLDEFRDNWKYNLGDEKLSKVFKHIPGYFQWDDHEVTNNWYPGEIMTSAPYNGIPANVLADRALQAFLEYTPVKERRIYRNYQHGKHVELFFLDERSFRGSNLNNLNPDGNEMLGAQQLDWFKRALKDSTATWKVISTHDPLGIIVRDGDGFDSFSNGEAAVLGREVQLAEILAFIKAEGIKNVVFLTSDVHFSAAISYQPDRATFKDFNDFYEFVVGPLNAGAFGPGDLDPSFGPEYEYVRAPGTEGLPPNSPPPYLQSFGMVEVSESGVMTVKLVDLTGEILFEKVLTPVL